MLVGAVARLKPLKSARSGAVFSLITSTSFARVIHRSNPLLFSSVNNIKSEKMSSYYPDGMLDTDSLGIAMEAGNKTGASATEKRRRKRQAAARLRIALRAEEPSTSKELRLGVPAQAIEAVAKKTKPTPKAKPLQPKEPSSTTTSMDWNSSNPHSHEDLFRDDHSPCPRLSFDSLASMTISAKVPRRKSLAYLANVAASASVSPAPSSPAAESTRESTPGTSGTATPTSTKTKRKHTPAAIAERIAREATALNGKEADLEVMRGYYEEGRREGRGSFIAIDVETYEFDHK